LVVLAGLLGLLGVGAGDPIPVEPEPRLPEPLLLPDPEVLPELVEPPVLPEPLVLPELLPYWRTQSSRSVPVLPMHWLGRAEGSLLELPVALGLVVEPPVALPLPVVCAQDTLASPRRAAAAAALSVFTITMYSLEVEWGDCSRLPCKRDAATWHARCRIASRRCPPRSALVRGRSQVLGFQSVSAGTVRANKPA
jgi:hypothetical protein